MAHYEVVAMVATKTDYVSVNTLKAAKSEAKRLANTADYDLVFVRKYIADEYYRVLHKLTWRR